MALWKLRLMLAMLLLLPGVARAQDVFAAGASPQGQTVSDSFSSSCIQAQKPNIFKQLGVNPLTCHAGAGLQDSQGQCMNVKGTTVIAHQGTECYYCTPNNPPVVLYIPMDQVQNASLQGFLCGESSVDPGCMAACSKEFPTTTTYVPPVAQPVVPALQNGQDTGDPCHPYYDLSTAAGIAAMQADAPRVAAACNASRCQHNPELTVCKNVNLQASVPATETASNSDAQMAQCICGQSAALPPGYISGSGTVLPVNYPPANAGCTGKSLKALPKWTPAQAAILKTALNGAIAMLQKAKAYTDKPTWDGPTQDLSATYLGNASAATQSRTRDDVNGALQLAQRIKNVGDNMFPGNASLLGPPAKGQAWVAYAVPIQTPMGQALIYILPPFWNEAPWAQAFTIVHELSHELEGGLKTDVVYGQTQCEHLAMSSTADIVGKLIVHFAYPDLPPATPQSPMQNADSFAFFVYFVANQK
jgi:hypothetical protein